MKVVRSVPDLRQALNELSAATELNPQTCQPSIGFVPTMGALHSGHASLLQRCRKDNLISVLSIFVNPTQFNRAEDFEKYPRLLEKDLEVAQANGVDIVFAPAFEDLYPSGYTLRIQETELSSQLEGAFRPGHFDGVLTVVAKLLGCVRPDRLYLGKKDYQQCVLLKKLVSELFLETVVIVCPVIRESSGLALSSRNLRLNEVQLESASKIHLIGSRARTADEVTRSLTELGFKVEYVTDLDDAFLADQKVRLVAAWISEVRLIDCIDLEAQ